MRTTTRAASLGAVLLMTVAAKKEEPPVDPGPAPTQEEFRALAVPAVLSGFFDPEAAQITWDHGITGGYWKPVLQRKVPGWWTCGLVNGKNRMGGYVGAHRFVVVVRNGVVAFSAVGDGGAYDFVTLGCQKAISGGVLPAPAPEATAPVHVASGPAPTGFAPLLGFEFYQMPTGALVKAVTPGSIADALGVHSGLMVTSVNGVGLAGLDFAVRAQLLSAAGEGATLAFEDHDAMKMERAPAPPVAAATTPNGHGAARRR